LRRVRATPCPSDQNVTIKLCAGNPLWVRSLAPCALRCKVIDAIDLQYANAVLDDIDLINAAGLLCDAPKCR